MKMMTINTTVMGEVTFKQSVYSVSGKKRPKCFFCNIFYKSQAIMMKFGI